MTDYPTNSTAKPYFGTDGEPRTLWQMVRDEPEWAVSRVKAGEEAIAQRDEYRNHLAVIAEMTGNEGDIGAAHEGVNALVEDLARHKRMFAAACEQLGNIQQALGSTVVGIEPALVRELIEERDAMAAHLEQLQEAGDKLREPWDLSTILGAETRRLIERWDKTRAESPVTSLARRDSLKQREAVLEMANDLAHEFNDKQLEIIRKRAERLGQQAEGHQ